MHRCSKHLVHLYHTHGVCAVDKPSLPPFHGFFQGERWPVEGHVLRHETSIHAVSMSLPMNDLSFIGLNHSNQMIVRMNQLPNSGPNAKRKCPHEQTRSISCITYLVSSFPGGVASRRKRSRDSKRGTGNCTNFGK